MKRNVTMEGLYTDTTCEAKSQKSGGSTLVRTIRKGMLPGFGSLLEIVSGGNKDKIFAAFEAHEYACELNGIMVTQQLQALGYTRDGCDRHEFMHGIAVEIEWLRDLNALYLKAEAAKGHEAAVKGVERLIANMGLAIMQCVEGDAVHTISRMTIQC